MMQNNYLVTQLCPLNKKKTIVYMDGTAGFALYNSELRRFGIKENEYLSDTVFEQIREEVLWPRAKERALNLITIAAKTTQEIHNKLRQGYYPEDICTRVVDFLQEYGYLNDYEYARCYLTGRMQSKGMRIIQMELRRKGIAEDVIKRVTEEAEPDEAGSIRRWLEKKAPDLAEMDYKQKKKVYLFLLNKGYSYEQINEVMNNCTKDLTFV